MRDISSLHFLLKLGKKSFCLEMVSPQVPDSSSHHHILYYTRCDHIELNVKTLTTSITEQLLTNTNMSSIVDRSEFPILTAEEALNNLRTYGGAKRRLYLAMYSSVYGGIVTDP
jgi:hypothetical protein